VGNITKLIPLVSSITSSHGPKVKPIKNAPKYQQGHHNHHHHHDTPNSSTGATNGSNENAAPGTQDSSNSAKEQDSTDVSEKTVPINAQDESFVGQQGGQGQGQQKKNRNKRGGRGRHHGSAGGAGIQDSSNSINGGVSIPLGEANV